MGTTAEIKKKQLLRLVIAGALTASVTAAGSSLAWASGKVPARASSSVHFVTFQVGTKAPQSAPSTNLVRGGSKVEFSPAKLTGVSVVTTSECSTSDYSFSIINTTSKNQRVTAQGSADEKIGPEEGVTACISAPGKYRFGVSSNPAAVLKVIAPAS